jgi:hypothetical protein
VNNSIRFASSCSLTADSVKAHDFFDFSTASALRCDATPSRNATIATAEAILRNSERDVASATAIPDNAPVHMAATTESELKNPGLASDRLGWLHQHYICASSGFLTHRTNLPSCITQVRKVWTAAWEAPLLEKHSANSMVEPKFGNHACSEGVNLATSTRKALSISLRSRSRKRDLRRRATSSRMEDVTSTVWSPKTSKDLG